MMPRMQALQALLGDMGINLRRGDVGMAEEQLNHAQICAMVEQVGGKGMPQRVRRNRSADPGLARKQFDAIPEGLPGQCPRARAGEYRSLCLPASRSERASRR